VKLRYFILFFIFSALPFISNGQQKVTYQWFYWIRYYNQTRINKKFTLHTEIDNRRYLNPSQQSQFFTHLHLHNLIKPWLDVALGFNFNLTRLPSNNSLSVPELRPWQEINVFSNATRKWQFLLRYRLDERFIHNYNTIELSNGYRFNLRHRFRVMASTRLARFKNKSLLSLKLYNEIMLNTGDVPRAFDQNRLSGSLEYQFNQRWSIESGYINILQPKTDTEYYDRHVIRTTLYHRIGGRLISED
jgi:Protein of unknown function (DUF2490)